MVSGMIVGEVRQGQHRNAIDAFKQVGVDRLVYSSFLGADREATTQVVTVDHHATELYLQASGLEWNVFRDNLYLDNYLYAFAQIALKEGRWRTCAGDERASLVAKRDCAAVGAALLLGNGKPNTGYNVTSSERISVREICELVSAKSGVEIVYDSMPEDELYAYYDSLHIPRVATGDFSRSPYKWCSEDIVTNEAAIRDGVMSAVFDDVETLTGAKPLTVSDLIDDAAKGWALPK
jgi:NAD(P)H dehydrogenase (quinone)